MLPLYRASVESCDHLRRKGCGNAGLIFDKFFDGWSCDRDKSAWKADKATWLERFAAGSVGEGDLLDEYAWRYALLAEAMGGKWAIFRLETRFVTGLGRAHPVENGFAWHHSLGTPYLPGSSVKGLTAAWYRLRMREKMSDPEVFGSPNGVGRVVFLDALPVQPLKLEVDVITPHYGGWSPEDLPGDWRSPNPIPFLVVPRGNLFFFGVLPVPGRGAVEHVEEAFELLKEALRELGGGAKTAVDYGRFVVDERGSQSLARKIGDRRRAEEEARRRREIEQRPEGRWLLELQGKSEDEILGMVARLIEKGQLESREEQKLFARAVLSLEMSRTWSKGKAYYPRTSTGYQKIKQRYRLLRSLLEEQD